MKNNIYTFDCRGNGEGKIVCTITGRHQVSVSDYTALVIYDEVL